MKAMILAAGRGERMRPLTDTTPKPLLKIGSRCLIEHHIDRLQQAGYLEIVINLSWLGNQIRNHLGNGEKYGVSIQYSDEGDTALETGGGIHHALPLLGEDRFLVVNGDVWCDHPLTTPHFHADELAQLILVNNPAHNHHGDFSLHKGLVRNQPGDLTFSGIGWYSPQLFTNCRAGIFPLAPLLRAAIGQEQVYGTHYQGTWSDIGTPERLSEIRQSSRS